ncbi:MAG: hypothetical protein M3124_03325 [Actinomycetota bacterium]|nr:hypothetical protein [Actinomycetota bacterium]
MRSTIIIGLVLVAVLSATACEGAASDDGGATNQGAGGQQPDDPVTSTPDSGGGRRAMKALEVELRDGLVQPRRHPFEDSKVVGDGEAVELYFWDGIQECGGPQRVESEYRVDEIVLTLFVGRNPEAEVCTEQAVYKVLTVPLEEPLDGRRVLDGAH